MRKPAIACGKTKTQISFPVTQQLISAFDFATYSYIQCLYFLNLKFQACSHLLWLYSPVCVGPGWTPKDRFSWDTAHVTDQNMSRVMRKPTFCICENKDADQLRSNGEADQRICFRYTDSTIPLLSKSEISSF